jgi:hypothetical protein
VQRRGNDRTNTHLSSPWEVRGSAMSSKELDEELASQRRSIKAKIRELESMLKTTEAKHYWLSSVIRYGIFLLRRMV